MRISTVLLAILAVIATVSAGCGVDRNTEEPPVRLVATIRSPGGVVELTWSDEDSRFQHWQYALVEFDDDLGRWVGEWRDMPRKRTRSPWLRLYGLESDSSYLVGVRPATHANDLSNPVDLPSLDPPPDGTAGWLWLRLPEIGSDGMVMPWSSDEVPVHGGDTYRLGASPYVFTAPLKGSWDAFGWDGHYFSLGIEHVDSGAFVAISPHTGVEDLLASGDSYKDRATVAASEAVREGYRLVEEIMNSVRYAPEAPGLQLVLEGEGKVLLEWSPQPRSRTSQVVRWDYRTGEGPTRWASENVAWGEWRRLPWHATSVRLSLEPENIAWRFFEVRPWTRDGPGEPQVASLQLAPAAGADDVPRMSADALHAGGRTWRYGDYVFDVPDEALLRFASWGVPVPWSPFSMEVGLLMDEASGSYMLLAPLTNHVLDLVAGDYPLHADTLPVLEREARPHPRGVDTEAMMDALLASMRYSAEELVDPLMALKGGAGEAVLRWQPAQDAVRWEYRYMEQWIDDQGVWVEAPWSSWIDVPQSDEQTTSHRVRGLEGTQLRSYYRFEVRPWTAAGPADTVGRALMAVPIATAQFPPSRGLVESGRTYQVGESTVGFDIPLGMLASVGCGRWESGNHGTSLCSPIITDVVSGSLLEISVRPDVEPRRYISPFTSGRDVDALFDEILDSVTRESVPLKRE